MIVRTSGLSVLIHMSHINLSKGRQCQRGFELTNEACTDINECDFHRFCQNKRCRNKVGGYTCHCPDGYKMNGTDCFDIDECADLSICPLNAACKNNRGNFICECDSGFEGSDCKDIDECGIDTFNCDGNATCSNNEASYECNCNAGYHGNGETCQIGNCDDRSCPLNGKCSSPTSNECECKDGFSFDTGTKVCEDINECLLGHDCGEKNNPLA